MGSSVEPRSPTISVHFGLKRKRFGGTQNVVIIYLFVILTHSISGA